MGCIVDLIGTMEATAICTFSSQLDFHHCRYRVKLSMVELFAISREEGRFGTFFS